MNNLTYIPNILWSQNEENISIKVILNDSKDLKINSNNSSINFNCTSNDKEYNFSFVLSKEIQSEDKINIHGRHISIILKKKEPIYWEKLTEDIKFKNFIKIDWDTWINVEDLYLSEENKSNEIDNMESMMRMMQNMNGDSNNKEKENCELNNNECLSGCCHP